ncbi:MAG: HEPN domain-containing protein [Planktothrix rubescens PR222]
MQSVIDRFQISIGRVRDLIALHNSIKAQSTNILDVSDILRGAFVLAVSALDYYVHEVVTLGMLEIYRGQRPEPRVTANTNQSAFARFKISLGTARQDRILALDIESWLEDEVQQQMQGEEFLEQPQTLSNLIPVISQSLSNKLNNISFLEIEIREQLSYKTFQEPDKIAEAIRLISDKKLWDEVATRIGRSTPDIKAELSANVGRRNKIAHEADINPTYNIGQRWPIDENQVNDAVNFIEQVVESIHQIL